MTAEQTDLLDLIANDPRHDPEYVRFLDACYQTAILDGRWLVSINGVRAMFCNGWGFTIEPHRYSSFWRRARLDGHLERTGEYETNTDAKGRNAGKPQPVYRWVGAS